MELSTADQLAQRLAELLAELQEIHDDLAKTHERRITVLSEIARLRTLVELTWESAPAPRGGVMRGRHQWKLIAPELRSKPGEWATFGPFAANSVGSIQRMLRTKYGLEARTQRCGPGEVKMWVRAPEVAHPD